MKIFTPLKVAITSALFIFLFTTVSFAQKVALFEDFEAKEWKSNTYTLRTVTDNLGTWSVAGVCNQDTKDRFHGMQSIRLRGNPGDNCYIQMDFNKTNGIGEASFYYASYSTHSGGEIVLYYSTDDGDSWISGGTVIAPAWSGEMLAATFPLNIPGNIRVKVVRENGLKTNTTVNIDDIYLTDFDCYYCVADPTFTPQGGICNAPVDATISCSTPDATIRYTLDGSDPIETSTAYSNAIAVATTTNIKAKAWKEGMEPSSISEVNYYFPQEVSTLSALRALAPPYEGSYDSTTVYKYTGNAVVTHVQDRNNVNVRFIQDETAAIMIYDNKGVLESEWKPGDLITNLNGTLSNFEGLLEFIPMEGKCDPIGTFKQVTPTLIPLSKLDYDYNNSIQAKLIKLENVMFTVSGKFEPNKYYALKQNNIPNDSVVFTDKWNADYIGDKIPKTNIYVNLTGVCKYTHGKNRLVMIDKKNDIVGITHINIALIKLSPNPANSFVNITTGSIMKLEIFSILGNLIATENLYEGTNTISVSNYPAGVYIMKMTDETNRKEYMQKLIIR